MCLCACVLLLLDSFWVLLWRLSDCASVVAVTYTYYSIKICKYGDLAVLIHYLKKKLQFIFACLLAGWLTGSVSAVCGCVSFGTCVLFLKRSVLVVKPQYNILYGVRRTDIYTINVVYKAQRYVVWNAYRLTVLTETEMVYAYTQASVCVYLYFCCSIYIYIY